MGVLDAGVVELGLAGAPTGRARPRWPGGAARRAPRRRARGRGPASRRTPARCRCRCRRRSASSPGSRGSRTARSAGTRAGPGRSAIVRLDVGCQQRDVVHAAGRRRRSVGLGAQVPSAQLGPLLGAVDVGAVALASLGRRSWSEDRCDVSRRYGAAMSSEHGTTDVDFLGLVADGDPGRFRFTVRNHLSRLDARLYGGTAIAVSLTAAELVSRARTAVDDDPVRLDRSRRCRDLGARRGARTGSTHQPGPRDRDRRVGGDHVRLARRHRDPPPPWADRHVRARPRGHTAGRVRAPWRTLRHDAAQRRHHRDAAPARGCRVRVGRRVPRAGGPVAPRSRARPDVHVGASA